MRHGTVSRLLRRPLQNLGHALLLPAALSFGGPKIEDVTLRLSGTAQVEIRFASIESESAFPAFFQKADSAGGTLLLSFLETDIALPLQAFELPVDAPLVSRVEVRRLRSPSGKLFLGIEFAMKKAPDPQAPWQAKVKGANTLTFAIGKAPKKTAYKAWSLAQSLTAPPVEVSPVAHPVEPVEPPKMEPVAAVPEPRAPENPAVTPAAPPVTASPEPAAPDIPETVAPATPVDVVQGKPTFHLLAIKVSVSAAKEEISLVFKGKDNPEYLVEGAAGISGTVVKLSRVQTDSMAGKYDLGRNGWVRSIRLKQKEESATLLFVTDSLLVPVVTAGKGKLTFAYPRRAGHPTYSWSSKHPSKLPVPASEPVVSAHSEGRKKEAASKDGGLSSGKVFTLAGSGKAMIVVRDSVSISSKPSKEATGRHLMAGESVRRLGSSGNFVRFLSGAGDTGYAAASALAYPDELSAAKIRSIEAKVKARTEAATAPPTPPVPAAETPKEPVAQQPAAEPVATPVEPAMPTEPVSAEPVPTKKSGKTKKTEPAPVAEPSLSIPSQADESRLGLSPEALAAEKRTAESDKVELAPRSTRVSYNSFSRRDPFIPLEQGGADQGIDIDQMKLVGIVKENEEPMAVLENIRDINISYTVRQGDPVHNGRVARISPESVTFDLTEFGISRSFTLKLVPSQERTGK